MRKIELLAPAQNLEIGLSAIRYGADAVYIGGESFGARKTAGNDTRDIEKLVKSAHKFGVKIYVALNTILEDKELIEAQKLINSLYNVGVDALIIQDMGLLELELPPIELHASTQCSIRTLQKVKFLEKIGFKRAILARELSIEEIKNISNNTNIELETFIHGALCVSYSGNCYMSAYIGGRSANRGECAQCCRKRYSLLDSSKNKIIQDKYLLSLKDFSAEKYLKELILAGVKSFKIEGRLKDENYVKNTVLYYRKLLDKCCEKTSKGDIISDFEPNINKTFNRGYTSYFLKDEHDFFNFSTPKSTGEYIGEIEYIKSNVIKIKTDKIVSPQDGLCFFEKGELKGCLVNKVMGDKIFLNREVSLKVKDKIYRNQDVLFESVLKNSKTKRLIKTEIKVFKDKITVSDGEFEACAKLPDYEIAKDKNKAKENFIKSFKKSGDSIFYADRVVFILSEIPFLPISVLNALRRELFAKLEEIRIKNCKRPLFNKISHNKYDDFIKDYRLNIHNQKAEEFYRACGLKDIERSLESTKNYKGREIMRTKHCLRRALNMCLKTGAKKQQLFLEDEKGSIYPLKFDCDVCEMAVIAP